MLSTRNKMRIARALNRVIVGARAVAGRESIVTVCRRGVNWRLGLNEGIDLAIYLGLYQTISQRVLDTWVRPGANVIDIGANIGSHSLPLALRVGPIGRVIAIEPTDYAYSKLCTNAALNPDFAKQLALVQAALNEGGIGPRETAFYSRWPVHGNDNGGAADRHPKHLGQAESARGARFLSLDSLVAELRQYGRINGPVKFVKLDVDGHELDVLRGAQRTFLENRPALLIEIAPYVQDEVPQRFEALLATLGDYGYRLEDQESGRELPMSSDALRSAIGRGAGFDVLALPI